MGEFSADLLFRASAFGFGNSFNKHEASYGLCSEAVCRLWHQKFVWFCFTNANYHADPSRVLFVHDELAGLLDLARPFWRVRGTTLLGFLPIDLSTESPDARNYFGGQSFPAASLRAFTEPEKPCHEVSRLLRP